MAGRIEVDAHLTEYGFKFGAAEVQRSYSWNGNVGITVKTDAGKELQICVSPTGRSLRVFQNGKELKAE